MKKNSLERNKRLIYEIDLFNKLNKCIFNELKEFKEKSQNENTKSNK